MLNIQELIEKIKDILGFENKNEKIYDKDVAQALGITQVNLASMKTRNTIPFQNILEFCALKRISINWLLYGQDPSSLIETTDKYWVKYFPNINLSAGGGSLNEEENYENIELPNYFVDILGGKQAIKYIDAVNVTGDSMEPTLENNSIVFLDRSKSVVTKSGIYAFLNNNDFFIKRLESVNSNIVNVISDNNQYPSFTHHIDEINVLGKIVGSFGKVY